MNTKEMDEVKNMLYSFISQMNNWEKYCNEIDQNKTLSFDIQFDKKKLSLQIFLTNFALQKNENLEDQLQFHMGIKTVMNMIPTLKNILS